MRCFKLMTVIYLACSASALAQPQWATSRWAFGQRMGPLEIDRMALGQGGLSDEPMWDSRTAEVRSLNLA